MSRCAHLGEAQAPTIGQAPVGPRCLLTFVARLVDYVDITSHLHAEAEHCGFLSGYPLACDIALARATRL